MTKKINNMTKEQLAAQLNGREATEEITEEECMAAKAAGLVVIFGYSDDNVVIHGAIEDEVGMYNGGTLYLHRDGVLGDDPESEDCARCRKRIMVQREKCVKIAVEWNTTNPYSWFIKPHIEGFIPFAPFGIVENINKFCRGIVVELKDLPSFIMKREAQDTVKYIYNYVSKLHRSAAKARNEATNEHQRLMLAGKAKAYTDVLALLKTRYGNKVVLPERIRQTSRADDDILGLLE
jgi:hypothetical protein